MELCTLELGKTPEEQKTSLKDDIFTHKCKRGLVKGPLQPPHPTFVNQNEEVQLLVEEMREGLGEMNNIKAEIANDKLEMKMQVNKMELVADQLLSMINMLGMPSQGHQAPLRKPLNMLKCLTRMSSSTPLRVALK